MATCAECKQPIPAYLHVHAGFVAPTPARPAGATDPLPEEQASIKISSGPHGVTLTGVERAVCRECYLTLFAKVYPGAELPRLPQRLED